MKLRILALLAVPALALGLGACTVEKDQEGGVDVQPADVQMDWDTTQVKTPDVNLVPQDSQSRDTASRDTQPQTQRR